MAEPRKRGWTRYLRPTVSNQMLWLLCLMYLIYHMDHMIDATGSWAYPFIASLVRLFLGSLLALRLRPDLPFTAEEPKLALAV